MEAKTPEAQSLKLMPQEIRSHEFGKSMWGYSPREVVEFLEGTAAAWEKVQRHEKELLEKVKNMSEELVRWKNKEIENPEDPREGCSGSRCDPSRGDQ